MTTLRACVLLVAVTLGLFSRGADDWVSDPTAQMVFQAVLEGLYTDGISNDDVDCVLCDPKTGQRDFRQHFVYSCPLCHPAYEAFVVYRGRPEFYGRKAPVSNFGKGLDASVSANLHEADLYKRRSTIGALIEKWIQRRLELMRLSEVERGQWSDRLNMLRKQGMAALYNGQVAAYKDKGCAVCDACVNGGANAFGLTSLRVSRSNKKETAKDVQVATPPPPAAVRPPKVKDEQF